jgi:hypothetical protein
MYYYFSNAYHMRGILESNFPSIYRLNRFWTLERYPFQLEPLYHTYGLHMDGRYSLSILELKGQVHWTMKSYDVTM